jgi:restriction endonuclease S subunit
VTLIYKPSLRIQKAIVERIPIPFPTISKQRVLVSELEAERTLVDANRELIARFEQKLQAKLAEIWGDEVP